MKEVEQKYQFLRGLTLEEYEALKESIQKYGVLQAIIVDEYDEIIDGYHRAKACEELAIDYPKRVMKGLKEEEKENLSVSLNLKRRHLTKEQKKELAIELCERGWSQERIAGVMEVTQGTISNWLTSINFNNYDKRVRNFKENKIANFRNRAEEAEKAAADLKNEIERLKAEKPKVVEKVVEKPADVDMAVIDKMVEQRAAEKIAELEDAKKKADASRAHYDEQWKHLEEVRERDKKNLQAKLDEKTQEIEKAAKKHLDIKKLQAEYDTLQSKKLNLEAEIKAEAIVRKIHDRLSSEHEAFMRSAAVLEMISNDILTRDDCGRIPIEDIERLEKDWAKIVAVSKRMIPAIHELIERIKKGGALRIVQEG